MSDLDALLLHLYREADRLRGDLWHGYNRAIDDIQEWINDDE